MNFAAVADMIERYGQPATLRRLAPHGIRFDVEVMAVVDGYQPNELAGDIMQGDQRAVISNREIAARQWPGPPRKGDQLIMDGKTATLVANPNTTQVGAETVKHEMQIRGA